MSDALKLSEGQEKAVVLIGKFLEDEGCSLATITGYAGTGKTTLIRVLADEYGAPIVLTPTGKAALRVTEATGLPAMTIHRFLYKPETDPKTGTPIFILKPFYELASFKEQFLLIDEASMIQQDVWRDLSSMSKLAGFKIVLMGDTFQLPPVMKNKDGSPFSALDTETSYRINLTEVIRQAQESPIIKASMILRESKPEFMAIQLLQPVGSGTLVEHIIKLRERGGVAIVHTNKRRHELNVAIRERMGFPPETIENGEPLLVMQNNYEIERYNGEVVTFDKWQMMPSDSTTIPVNDRYKNNAMEIAYGVGLIEGKPAMLAVQEVCGKTADKIGLGAIKTYSRVAYFGEDPSGQPPPFLHTNYGYALTCHKSQGSEWDETTVVLEDSLKGMPAQDRRRWLYTAITRAKTKVFYAHA